MDNGKYSQFIEFVEDRPGHDKRYALGNKRLKLLTGNLVQSGLMD